ncbi:hypothetical protein BOX15_Mlig023954g2 [Macrostomum lignano]|uniref:Uncharacterized protein n=2 Tax=Macrostomum lignano TaxID=282301 RepID=A0A267E4I6_9PLAT|nr:hypothetical protein BOX15_Mlig014543g2 [Macrostomum lignano]PAA80394.1 hypothetical protein BOX15_Mlig023954g3 [Macrostomum lignano]PAA94841.1 hypothetical protein BOX15_Mlig023954g2 [Macrostomum lignano]
MVGKKESAKKLRTKTKVDLEKQLNELKQELATLRVAKVTGGAASKLAQIHQVRKMIARVYTVIHQTQKDAVRQFQKKSSKRFSRDLRAKKTRALRRALTPFEASRTTAKQQRRKRAFPVRRFAVKA